MTETPQGVQCTVDDFHARNPLPLLILLLPARGFGRGLPVDIKLADPVVAFSRALIRNGEVEEGVENHETLLMCHRYGWIHGSMTSSDPPVIRYTFASPLHSAAVSWALPLSNDMLHYPSIFALCLAVISDFKPSQMHTPIRRVGTPSGAIDRQPEAQYQDEFYRSLFAATAGSVRISPQFASAKGAHIPSFIDFFILGVKWGIEISRDGDCLLEFPAKFIRSGGYSAWLQSNNLTDYILLNCCTSVPRQAHLGMIF